MFEAIRHNLSNLTNFSGRDSRSTFWFYVLFLAITQVAVSLGLSMMAGGMMVADAFRAASAGAEQSAIERQMFAGIGDMMRISGWGSLLMSLAMTVLLAAALTRRLHDADKPGWIAAAVVAMQLISIVLAIGIMDEIATLFASLDPDDPVAVQAAIQAQQGKYAFRGALGWLPMLAVVVFGVWPSSDGNNRYRAEPDHI